MSDSARARWYGFTVFVASALLLVLEIAAGRLIAPYVGVSLYTWTSVIGIILAGLSIGNWIGGVWADRGADARTVGAVLGLAGIASLGVLAVLTWVAPAIQAGGFSPLTASFLYVLALFFVPALLLGIVTPLLTTLALRLDARQGHVVGRMHALAALGSIVGTFAAGYWLIQYFGTRTVVGACAVVLFVLAAMFFGRAARAVPTLIVLGAVAVAALVWLRDGLATPCERESQYYCIRVTDASDQAPFGEARALVLDHLLHGINHATEPGMLIAPYVHLMDELSLRYLGAAAAHGRYFFAGGGAYTQPRALRALAPQARITVAELDPQVTAVARERMYLDTAGMRVLHTDARVALQSLADERFDVIVGDVFHDVAVPYHLTTLEYAHLIRARLAPGGLYVLNVVDAFPDPLLAKSLFKTLSAVFAQVHVWLDRLPEAPTRVTYVISATDAGEPPEYLEASRGFADRWVRITDPLLRTGTPIDTLPVLTDDFVPVERLVARLIMTELGE